MRTVVVWTVRFLTKVVSKVRRRNKGTPTAWYEGVNVVILCLFRACSKKNNFTLSAICETPVTRVIVSQALDDASRSRPYLNGRQERTPLVYQLGEHAVWSTLFHLSKPPKHGELVIGHPHVHLQTY